MNDEAIGSRTFMAVTLAALCLAGVTVTSAAQAQDGVGDGTELASVRYRVSYGIVPVGTMDTTFRVGADGYTIDASFGTGGLVELIRSTEGTASASGTLVDGTVPEAFSIAYTYGDRSRAREIAFEDGTVEEATLTPPPRADDDRTPPTPDELRGAIDPASALIVRAASGTEACRRTLRVFDGRALVELAMKPSRTKPFRAGDWRGEVQVCDVVATPIAGTRESSEREIEAVRGATLALAPTPGGDTWIAVELRVPSSVGMISTRAISLDFTSD